MGPESVDLFRAHGKNVGATYDPMDDEIRQWMESGYYVDRGSDGRCEGKTDELHGTAVCEEMGVESTSNIKESASNVKESTSNVKESTSNSKESASNSKENASNSKESINNSKESTSNSKKSINNSN